LKVFIAKITDWGVVAVVSLTYLIPFLVAISSCLLETPLKLERTFLIFFSGILKILTAAIAAETLESLNPVRGLKALCFFFVFATSSGVKK